MGTGSGLPLLIHQNCTYRPVLVPVFHNLSPTARARMAWLKISPQPLVGTAFPPAFLFFAGALARFGFHRRNWRRRLLFVSRALGGRRALPFGGSSVRS